MHEDLLASEKFVLISNEAIASLGSAFTADLYLTDNGKRLAKRFLNEAGQCLGGGILKSRHLLSIAKAARPGFYEGISRSIAKKKGRAALDAANDHQSQWIALEYAVAFYIPMCDYNFPIRWDRINLIRASKSGLFGGSMKVEIEYLEEGKIPKKFGFEANAAGIQSLLSIANKAGVATSIG